MPDTPKDDLEPWLIPEQEWVLIPVTPVEPDEEPKPEGDRETMPQLATKAKRAASLSRVSTPAQAKSDRFGIPVQREGNRKYCEQIGANLSE